MYKDFYTTKMCTGKRVIEKRFKNIQNAKPIKGAAAVMSVITAMVILTASVFASGAADKLVNDNNGIEVSYNGETLNFWNKPFIDNYEVYLPLREVLNACGVANEDITYDNGKINVLLHSYTEDKDINMEITVGKYGARFDVDDDWLNESGGRDTSHPVIVKNGVTYAPVGVFSHIKSLGIDPFTDEDRQKQEKWFIDDFRVSNVLQFHLADGLEVKRRYEDGTFDTLLSHSIDVKGENKFDPAEYYEEGERVVVGTVDEQNESIDFNYTTVNGRYFPSEPVKRIILDDDGKVVYIALVENQKYEGLNRSDGESMVMDNHAKIPEISKSDENRSGVFVGDELKQTALSIGVKREETAEEKAKRETSGRIADVAYNVTAGSIEAVSGNSAEETAEEKAVHETSGRIADVVYNVTVDSNEVDFGNPVSVYNITVDSIDAGFGNPVTVNVITNSAEAVSGNSVGVYNVTTDSIDAVSGNSVEVEIGEGESIQDVDIGDIVISYSHMQTYIYIPTDLMVQPY